MFKAKKYMCECDTPERTDWYGQLLCDHCIDMEINFDWEGYEELRRKRIQEQNEY